MQYLIIFISLASALFLKTTTMVAPYDEPVNLYRSTDGGQHWEPFAQGLPEEVVPAQFLEIESQVVLLTRKHGVFQRAKGNMVATCQQAWVRLDQDLPNDVMYTTMAVSGDRMVVGTFEHGVFISQDRGLHWHQPVENLKEMVQSLLFHQGYLLAATRGGFFLSSDGGESWQPYQQIKGVIKLEMHKGKVMAASQSSVGELVGEAISWSGLRTDWAINQLIPFQDYLYAKTARGKVYRSTDGVVWDAYFSFLPAMTAKNLPEALWQGYQPSLPGEQPVGPLLQTSIGWLAGVQAGC